MLAGFESVQNKLDGYVNVEDFGTQANGIMDDTCAIQKAIDFAYETNSTLLIPKGIYRVNDLVLKCDIKGQNNPILLFNKNNGFTNYEKDGTVKYTIKKIDGVIFESDKSCCWKESLTDVEITRKDVILKYGQRIFIGNKTTQPNNIFAESEKDIKNGTGWWNRDYNQWIESENVDVENTKTVYADIPNKEETNVISAPRGIVISNCRFSGFTVGLTLKGTYNSDLYNCEFSRCKIGVVTTHAGTLPGALQDTAAKVTTLEIHKCLFEDISYFGVYGDSILQAKIHNNIFQPVGVAVVLTAGADNHIYDNYHEIVHTGVILSTNDVTNCLIENNYTNKKYSKYAVYMRYGKYNKIGKHLGNVKVYVAPSTENNDFDEILELTKDNYFYVNGNSIARNKSKFVIFTTTGVGGAGIVTKVKQNSRADNILPPLRVSQTGLEFTGIEEILSVEVLQDYNHKAIVTYYNVENGGNPKVFYVEEWDDTKKEFVRKDLRTEGAKCSFRVAFNDGYKA